jgi:hypothetical protein
MRDEQSSKIMPVVASDNGVAGKRISKAHWSISIVLQGLVQV